MLQKLSIRNYALIDNVELELDKGLNIITGETGAGKSIMLGALSLILGQRAETKYFFNQEKKCVIEGLFTTNGTALQSLFEDHDLDFQKESILRREISIDGKSRAFINDTPVTLSVMKQLGERLIDIHSQHATLEISDLSFQLAIVDTLANHEALLVSYKRLFKKYKKNQELLITLTNAASEASNKQDYEQFLFNELETANLKPNEQTELESELEVLNNAEKIKRGLLSAYQLISEDENSAVPILKEAISQLQAIETYNPEYTTINERLRSVFIELKDIAQDTASLEEAVSFNLQRIDEITQRLNVIYVLQQKHRVTTNEELIKIQDQLSNNLSSLIDGEAEIERLTLEIAQMKEELMTEAKIISENRKQSILLAEAQVEEILFQVGMPNARIKIEQTSLAELNKHGMDQINLLFSANLGQVPAPVGKIASGGELSRLMLAIKSIMAKHTALPTLIFDEIDTGISGETAVRVGQVIGNLEENMQVVCITHLPQIAARGNAHYFVYKIEDAERTTTGIKRLNKKERIQSIAEMLSGKDPASSALQNAKALLDFKN